jgi:hypothetical protein
VSSAYKAAASSAMLVGQSGAAPGNQTPHLARTKGLPRHLGLNGVLASRSGVEPPQPTFAGSVLKSVSREKIGASCRSRTHHVNVRSVDSAVRRTMHCWFSTLVSIQAVAANLAALRAL